MLIKIGLLEFINLLIFPFNIKYKNYCSAKKVKEVYISTQLTHTEHLLQGSWDGCRSANVPCPARVPVHVWVRECAWEPPVLSSDPLLGCTASLSLNMDQHFLYESEIQAA